MAQGNVGMNEYNWSFYYTVFRFVAEIVRAEKKTMADYDRAELLDIVREVSAALGAHMPEDRPREPVIR